MAEDIHSGLFNSLTSHRDQQQAEPHLGLGLYIVRIIAEYHQGKAAAENLKDNRWRLFLCRDTCCQAQQNYQFIIALFAAWFIGLAISPVKPIRISYCAPSNMGR